jgi:hypothetical protein
MSTICKLDPMVRMRRKMRQRLLRNLPPRPNNAEGISIYMALTSELFNIRNRSNMTGAAKDQQFRKIMPSLAALAHTKPTLSRL